MLTALLIMLREGFEAALVVAIVYAYIRRIGRRDLVAPMWQGMAAAAAGSVAAGVVVHLTVENLRVRFPSRTGFTDDSNELLVRLRTLTAQARAQAAVQRSRVELAIALQRGMLPGVPPGCARVE